MVNIKEEEEQVESNIFQLKTQPQLLHHLAGLLKYKPDKIVKSYLDYSIGNLYASIHKQLALGVDGLAQVALVEKSINQGELLYANDIKRDHINTQGSSHIHMDLIDDNGLLGKIADKTLQNMSLEQLRQNVANDVLLMNQDPSQRAHQAFGTTGYVTERLFTNENINNLSLTTLQRLHQIKAPPLSKGHKASKWSALEDRQIRRLQNAQDPNYYYSLQDQRFDKEVKDLLDQLDAMEIGAMNRERQIAAGQALGAADQRALDAQQLQDEQRLNMMQKQRRNERTRMAKGISKVLRGWTGSKDFKIGEIEDHANQLAEQLQLDEYRRGEEQDEFIADGGEGGEDEQDEFKDEDDDDADEDGGGQIGGMSNRSRLQTVREQSSEESKGRNPSDPSDYDPSSLAEELQPVTQRSPQQSSPLLQQQNVDEVQLPPLELFIVPANTTIINEGRNVQVLAQEVPEEEKKVEEEVKEPMTIIKSPVDSPLTAAAKARIKANPKSPPKKQQGKKQTYEDVVRKKNLDPNEAMYPPAQGSYLHYGGNKTTVNKMSELDFQQLGGALFKANRPLTYEEHFLLQQRFLKKYGGHYNATKEQYELPNKGTSSYQYARMGLTEVQQTFKKYLPRRPSDSVHGDDVAEVQEFEILNNPYYQPLNIIPGLDEQQKFIIAQHLMEEDGKVSANVIRQLKSLQSLKGYGDNKELRSALTDFGILKKKGISSEVVDQVYMRKVIREYKTKYGLQ